MPKLSNYSHEAQRLYLSHDPFPFKGVSSFERRICHLQSIAQPLIISVRFPRFVRVQELGSVAGQWPKSNVFFFTLEGAGAEHLTKSRRKSTNSGVSCGTSAEMVRDGTSAAISVAEAWTSRMASYKRLRRKTEA